jgi:hypothetical protein
MPSRSKRFYLLAVVVAVFGLGAAAFWGLHRRYIPAEAIETSRRFIALMESGDLRDAYALTAQDRLCGTSFQAFEAKARIQLAEVVQRTHPPVEFVRESNGFQTYGNRVRRWLAGRKLDPDTLSLEFMVGTPFEVRLVSSGDGKWKIAYFQSHAA